MSEERPKLDAMEVGNRPEVEFLEESQTLNDVWAMARKYVSNEMGPEEMETYLNEKLKEHDKGSYDCHTFVLQVLRKDLNIEVEKPPKYPLPSRNAFPNFTMYQHYLEALLKRGMKTPKGEKFQLKLESFFEVVYKEGTRISLPDATHKTEDSERVEEETKLKTEEIMEEMKGSRKSRILLFSGDDLKGEKVIPLHSLVILGETEKGDDLICMHKSSPGEIIAIDELSDVIRRYITHPDHKNVEISISDENIGDLYSKAE